MLQITTHGWFLSRAISSRIACRCALCVSALTVSSENVVNPWAPKTPPARPMLMPTAGVSSITTMPWRSAYSSTSSAYG
jgi:hypothetical protein